jgi:predicted PurR-regulated permease PerM
MTSFTQRYTRGVFLLLGLVLLVLGGFMVLPFVPSILWASVLSILLYPVYRQWRLFLRKSPLFANGRAETAAAICATLAAFVIIIIPFFLVGAGIFQQAHSITEEIAGQTGTNSRSLSLDDVLRYVDNAIKPLASQIGATKFSLRQYVEENRKDIVDNLRVPLTNAAKGVATTTLTLVIALLTMFFMLRDGERMHEPAVELVPLPRDKAEGIFKRVTDTVWAVFVGTVLVAIIQGAVMGLTYFWLGVPNALLLGVFSIILCIIPLLGAPVLYIPIGLFFLAKGDVQSALIVYGVGFGIVSNIDNALKPFLIGGRTNMHPMFVFFAILGGVLLYGPIGVMAGPMLLTIILAMVEVVRERLQLDQEAAPSSIE